MNAYGDTTLHHTVAFFAFITAIVLMFYVFLGESERSQKCIASGGFLIESYSTEVCVSARAILYVVEE